MEACFEARFPQEGVRQGEPDPQEFVSKAIQELQESRVMRGARRLPAVAPHPGEDGGLRVCIDIPGLNRVASLALASGALRRPTPQLRSHALRLAERG